MLVDAGTVKEQAVHARKCSVGKSGRSSCFSVNSDRHTHAHSVYVKRALPIYRCWMARVRRAMSVKACGLVWFGLVWCNLALSHVHRASSCLTRHTMLTRHTQLTRHSQLITLILSSFDQVRHRALLVCRVLQRVRTGTHARAETNRQRHTDTHTYA